MSNIERRLVWNIPNFLCLIRLVGCLPLLLLAMAGQPAWFAGVYLGLAFTDLIDGPLARLLNQRSRMGAGLDSLADVTLSICLVGGAAILRWDRIQGELAWIAVATLIYVVAIVTGWCKFGRFPSYHTWTAKLTHFLVVVAGLVVVADWSVWPLRVAAVSAIIANTENILITRRLSRWQADVPSVLSLAAEDADGHPSPDYQPNQAEGDGTSTGSSQPQ
jgi:CDP-diacylglycerol--glycerol-3-phosphate 3-phosphatidyltransferase